MNLLGLETSGREPGIGVFCGDRCLAETRLAPNQKGAEHLPAVAEKLLLSLDWTPRDIDTVAVTVGPGSFTGIRTGVTLAKVFAYVTGARIISIDVMEALALQVPPPYEWLDVVVDAQRRELLVATYQANAAGDLRLVQPPRILTAKQWVETSDRSPGRQLICGPGLRRAAAQPSAALIAEPDGQRLNLATLGRLARTKAQKEQFSDAWTLVPDYHRPSAAEENATKP